MREEDSPVGKVGRIIVRVRGGQEPGEVALTVAGAPEIYLAYCRTGLALQTQVLVIHDRGGRGVDVEPWRFTDPGHLADGEAGQQTR